MPDGLVISGQKQQIISALTLNPAGVQIRVVSYSAQKKPHRKTTCGPDSL